MSDRLSGGRSSPKDFQNVYDALSSSGPGDWTTAYGQLKFIYNVLWTLLVYFSNIRDEDAYDPDVDPNDTIGTIITNLENILTKNTEIDTVLDSSKTVLDDILTKLTELDTAQDSTNTNLTTEIKINFSAAGAIALAGALLVQTNSLIDQMKAGTNLTAIKSVAGVEQFGLSAQGGMVNTDQQKTSLYGENGTPAEITTQGADTLSNTYNQLIVGAMLYALNSTGSWDRLRSNASYFLKTSVSDLHKSYRSSTTGANLTQSVPANYSWMWDGCMVKIETDVNVANRNLTFTIYNGSNEKLFEEVFTANMTASNTYYFHLHRQSHNDSAFSNGVIKHDTPKLHLEYGDYLVATVSNVQAGDIVVIDSNIREVRQ